MKNPEHVAALLAELRTLAESDFERHRIDVLERDLHEPPAVEIIDDKHQKFDGVIYRKHRKHYESCNGVHRAVYTYYNGEIPDGCEIHHIDENPNNNSIENLQCVTAAEHKAIHNQLNRVEMTCEVCGERYIGQYNGHNRYCKKCVSRLSGNPLKDKICAWCGKEFKTPRKQVRYCSVQCANQARYVGHKIQKICPVCGQSFETSKSDDCETCSRSCSTILQWQRRRETKS